MEPVNAAIIYYSSTGTVHALARAAGRRRGKGRRTRATAQGCRTGPTGGDQRQPGLGLTHPGHCRHRRGQPRRPGLGRRGAVRHPTRYGTPASQLKAFIDTTGGPVATGHTRRQGVLGSHRHRHRPRRTRVHPPGAGECVLPLGRHHRAPGYTDPVQFQTGNPYGTSHLAADGPPDDVALGAARYQAGRAVDTAASLKAGRAA
jgi:NAD(P)H dehydrogenase (quinone)